MNAARRQLMAFFVLSTGSYSSLLVWLLSRKIKWILLLIWLLYKKKKANHFQSRLYWASLLVLGNLEFLSPCASAKNFKQLLPQAYLVCWTVSVRKYKLKQGLLSFEHWFEMLKTLIPVDGKVKETDGFLIQSRSFILTVEPNITHCGREETLSFFRSR